MKPWRLIHHPSLESTNGFATANISDLRDRDAIQADIQTQGRGRMRRKWISDIPGNLCLSLVLKPTSDASERLPLCNLSQWLAIAVCRVIRSLGATPAIKWPNDIQVNQRKIAGILAESMVKGKELLGIILGIGVNLNLDETVLEQIDQPATALSIELLRRVDVDSFRDALLDCFFQEYDAFLIRGFPLIRDEYLNQANFIGRHLTIKTFEETQQGIARDVNDEGALILETEPNGFQVITLGDVFFTGQ